MAAFCIKIAALCIEIAALCIEIVAIVAEKYNLGRRKTYQVRVNLDSPLSDQTGEGHPLTRIH